MSHNRDHLPQSLSRFSSKESTVTNLGNDLISEGSHGYNAANVKEIEIPLSYGKIAGKAWGSVTASPVLALHGWMDNCGTFDRLIPLLSDRFYFVAIDVPGHGKSSHLPPGCLYTDMSIILDFKKVIDHLGWKKFHLMGHSLGGSFVLLFSSIFPDLVDKVISLDTVKTFSLPADVVAVSKIKALSQLLDIEEKLMKPPPVYPIESAPARLKKGMHHEITEEGAEILLKRGAKTSDCGKGLVFSRDLRWQSVVFLSVQSDEVVEKFMCGLRCKMLLILANNTHPKYQLETPGSIEKYIAMYRQNLQDFVLEHVDGNHFVHLNNPERIAPIVNKFLLN